MKKVKLFVAAILAVFAINATALAADVTVSWPANPAVEQAEYLLEYRVNNALPWIVLADNMTTTTLTTNLADGSLYQFRAAAKNITGTSAYSGMVAPPDAPSQPAQPVVVATGNSLTVSWAPNPAEEGAKYSLQYRRNGGAWLTPLLLINSTNTTFTQEFPQGTLYGFRVTASNITGTSTYSLEGSGPPVPSVPGPLTVVVE